MKGYQVLLIDEISLVSAEMLTFILSTFGRLHGNAKPFGGICVIDFGDLLQLSPIVGQQVFKCMLWWLFFSLFLTQWRCQIGQAEFMDILNEVHIGHISTKAWQNLMDIYLAYSPGRDLYKSTFIASYRKTAHGDESACIRQYSFGSKGSLCSRSRRDTGTTIRTELQDIQVISDQSTRGSGPTWSHYEGHVLR